MTLSRPASAAGTLDDLSASLRGRERSENFPVAFRLLPAPLRADLLAVYAVARTIDTIGDDLPGDRLATLDAFEADLLAIWSDRDPRLDVNRRLAATVRHRGLSATPFRALVEANRVDQRVSSYPSWSDLRGYCALSADPVGQIVLEISGSLTADRRAWSDDVCTALQMLEHCQDVREDYRRGRIYLPADELDAHDVSAADLDAAVASPGLRRAVLDQVVRARLLLRSGRPLVRSLRGGPRLAVAGFVAGGLATADAIDATAGDVLTHSPRPTRARTAWHALALVTGGRR
jgi:squalene synthase HpnC